MKPRTKLQKLVEESAKTLLPLSLKEQEQAFKKLSSHLMKKDSKGNCYCLDCGHSWKGSEEDRKADSVICPHCGNKLKWEITRKRKFYLCDYFEKITTCNGFQVIRVFFFQMYMVKSEAPKVYIREVYQRWTKPNQKTVIRSLKQTTSWNLDAWSWYSGLEIREERYQHNIHPACRVGVMKLLPIVRKLGLTNELHGMNFTDVLETLLSNNKFETLWKLKQWSFAKYYLNSHFDLSDFWPQIKIAIRHKYKVNHVSIWLDTIRMLRRLGKDDRNPKFICPEKLMQEHDKMLIKIRQLEEKERLEAMQKKYYADLELAKQKEDMYKAEKGCYFPLEFEDKEILVTPLKSVEEFLNEGEKQHHCVYANKYYEKKDVLILHALVEGESVATIELSLKTMEVLQCRGKYNKEPEQKERIVNLIKNNVGKIVKCQKSGAINAA